MTREPPATLPARRRILPDSALRRSCEGKTVRRSPGGVGHSWTLLLLAVLLWPPLLPAAGHEEPLTLVRNTADQMLAEMKNRKRELQANPEKIYRLVDQIVLPRFDFERMSRLALGRHWRKASEQQRKAFVAAFRQLLVRTYATALLNYSDEQIVYKPLRQEPTGKEAVVNTLVSEPGGSPVPIDYRLHQGSDGHWRVYDVIVDGVSLVSNYRSSFASEIRRRGMDGLIRKLQAMGGQEEG